MLYMMVRQNIWLLSIMQRVSLHTFGVMFCEESEELI